MALVGSALISLLPAQDIDLTGYTLSFDDEFSTLSISAANPKGAAKWFSGPANGATGDFSASNWNIDAFSVAGGILSDQAWYAEPAINGQNWQSGLISSVDPSVAGFSQKYGYFEIRCQMPNAGDGAWPSFWLDSTSGIGGGQNEEIDIFEWYGICNTPGSDQPYIQQASHNWNADGSQNQALPYLYSPQTTVPGGGFPWQGYHTYGCQIDSAHITWYIDGVQTNQVATPASYTANPFYMMVDYALGGGWPLTGSPLATGGSSSLLVDWVRVYSLPSGGTTAPTGGTGSGTSTPPVSGTGSAGSVPPPVTGSTSNSIGVQFRGTGTPLLATDAAGLASVAQTNWNVLSGAVFSGQALSDSSGAATTASLSGSANGPYFAGGSYALPVGNAKLASGELYNGWPGDPSLTVSNIPYANYDVYVYASIDASNRAETTSLTPSGGSAQNFSFTTEGGGSAWTVATSTWNGTGTKPNLPAANYVHYTGLTASSFTLAWGAPGNGGLNGIQVVPNTSAVTTPVTPPVIAPAITTQPSDLALTAGGSGTLSMVASGTAPLTYQWYLNANAIAGAASASYAISSATAANAGTYDVVATNSAGQATSTNATVTVTEAPTLLSAASLQVHEGTGYSIALPLGGSPGVECRKVNGSLQLVFTFDQEITSGTVAITSGDATVDGAPVFSGDTMTVNLADVADVQSLTVKVSGLNGTDGSNEITFNVLCGDINGDGEVTLQDLIAVRSDLGMSSGRTGFNPRCDVTEDGLVNSQDLVQVRDCLGHQIP